MIPIQSEYPESGRTTRASGSYSRPKCTPPCQLLLTERAIKKKFNFYSHSSIKYMGTSYFSAACKLSRTYNMVNTHPNVMAQVCCLPQVQCLPPQCLVRSHCHWQSFVPRKSVIEQPVKSQNIISGGSLINHLSTEILQWEPFHGVYAEYRVRLNNSKSSGDCIRIPDQILYRSLDQ